MTGPDYGTGAFMGMADAELESMGYLALLIGKHLSNLHAALGNAGEGRFDDDLHEIEGTLDDLMGMLGRVGMDVIDEVRGVLDRTGWGGDAN